MHKTKLFLIKLKPLFLFVGLAVLLLEFGSCAKSRPQYTGSETITLEATTYQNLSDHAAANQVQLYVENANLYDLMIGKIMSDLVNDSIKNKPAAISEVELISVSLSSIEIDIPFDADSASELISGGTLKLQHLTGIDYESLVLAGFDQVNTETNKVEFIISAIPDLAGHIENNQPDRLYFDLTLNRMPTSDLLANYMLVFEYDYSYVATEQ